MNPDTGHSVRSGRPMTSVYVTSGEADGLNAPGRASAAARRTHRRVRHLHPPRPGCRLPS
ncbi:hypothetical protein ACFWBH_12810 [Streptomyces sp. NPDC059999]|uniref:hypothetical protein n=1 Tax=Streptomyces sp. NPDC059999 TaxID=3347030 RepID=UPI0036868D04